MTVPTPEVLTTNLRIAELELGVFSPRKQFDTHWIDELGESIAVEGQHKPILVRVHPTQPNKYQVIDGEHRVRALQKIGKTLVRAEILPLDDEQAYFMAMRVNQMHGKPLEALEEALHIKRMMETFGYTQQKIAEMFKRVQQWVSDRLKLVEEASPELLEAFTKRFVKPSQVYEITELPKDEQPQIVEKVAGSKLSSRATEALVHALKAAKTIEEKQMILSKPVEVYAELYKQREALQRSLAAQPEQPAYQRLECPCGCGWSLWIQWNERTAKWEH